jgi:hypothetical protein
MWTAISMRAMPADDLTDDELAAILRLLRNAIDADRFHHSDRVRTWKAALAKLDPSSAARPADPPKPLLPQAGRTRGTARR